MKIHRKIDKQSWERKYDETFEWYIRQYKEQNGLCFICEKNPIAATDHCHYCGRLRTLLCTKCNIAVGFLKEDIPWMQKVLEYVKVHHKVYKHTKIVIDLDPQEILKHDFVEEIGTILKNKEPNPSVSP
jgi:hypothetical protein